jgi:hypothetical protein
MLPKLTPKRARAVITKIDEILGWERKADRDRDTCFVEVARYLCELRAMIIIIDHGIIMWSSMNRFESAVAQHKNVRLLKEP